jgi:hypothetical protein
MNSQELLIINDSIDILVNKLSDLTQKKMNILWGNPNPPEFFEHRMDQFYQMRSKKNTFWLERGVINKITIQENAKILELSCGDGYFAYHFYSSNNPILLDCIDIDKDAIDICNKYHSDSKISYYCEDIKIFIPKNTYTNIIWDAAIEHFSEEDIHTLIVKYKNYLEQDGLFTGYTIQKNLIGLQHPDHLCEMNDKEHLASFFTPYFKNVLILETTCSERINYYFYASDGVLPLTIKDEKYLLKTK